MTEMAKQLAVAKQAISEIGKVEGRMEVEADTLYEDEFKEGAKEVVQFATMIADAAQEAIGILRGVRADVEAYRGSL